MNDKPSYLTSTFSLVTLIVTTGLTGLCVWIKDAATLKEIAMLVLGGYGVKKGMEFAKGNQPSTPDSEKPSLEHP